MSQSLHTILVNLLESASLPDDEIRRLIGWSALSLTDLLRRKCITVRYAEQTLFNLNVVRQLEQRQLEDCMEVVDWGMQLEDWEEHTPEQLSDAFATIELLARRLLVIHAASPPSTAEPIRRRGQQQSRHRTKGQVIVETSP